MDDKNIVQLYWEHIYEQCLTVDEYNAAIAAHPRVEIEMEPITEFGS